MHHVELIALQMPVADVVILIQVRRHLACEPAPRRIKELDTVGAMSEFDTLKLWIQFCEAIRYTAWRYSKGLRGAP